MNINNIPDEQLIWKLIDGELAEGEQQRIEELVANDAGWAALYNELLQLHHLAAGAEMEQPSMRFAKNVMEAISAQAVVPSVRSYINKRLVAAMAVFVGLITLAGIVYLLSLINASSGEGDSGAAMQWSTGKFPAGLALYLFALLNMLSALLLITQYLSYRKLHARHNEH